MFSGQRYGGSPGIPAVLVLLACLVLLVSSPSGALTIAWESSIGGAGDEGIAWLAPLPSGGFFVAGNTSTDARGGSDILLVRTDSRGRPVQTVRHGTGPARDEPLVGALVPGGGAVVVGLSIPDSQPPVLHLLQVDPQLALVWERTYPARNGPDDAFGVAVLADGGFLVLAGQATETGRSILLLRLEPDGTERWRRTLVSRPGLARAGLLARLSDGGFLVAGADDRAVQHDLDLFVFRLDGEGRTLWERSFPDPGANFFPVTAAESPDRRVVIAGIEDGPYGTRVAATAIDPFGRSAWSWGGWPAAGPADVGAVVFADETCLVVGSGSGLDRQGEASHLVLVEIRPDGVEQSRFTASPVDGDEQGRAAVAVGSVVLLGIEGRSTWTHGTDILLRAVSADGDPDATAPQSTPTCPPTQPVAHSMTHVPSPTPSPPAEASFSLLPALGAVGTLLLAVGRREAE